MYQLIFLSFKQAQISRALSLQYFINHHDPLNEIKQYYVFVK